MNKTQIEWVKNPDGSPGYTFNPITGCLNHVNGLCKGGGFPCYAYKLANGRLKSLYLANKNVASVTKNVLLPNLGFVEMNSFYPRFWPERLYHPWSGKPKGIFVCDMSDLFGQGIPEEWTEKVMNLMRKHDENRYYLLTKQPQNLIEFSPFPDNCWVGVTATNAKMFVDAGKILQNIEATVKYLSCEPLLSWDTANPGFIATMLKIWGINWLIIGAQTKPTVYPKIEWVREIVEAADRVGIPVFLKDNLRPLLPVGLPFYRAKSLEHTEGKHQEWEWELRQEMPKC